MHKKIFFNNLFTLILFLSIVITQSIQCQSDSSLSDNNRNISNRIYLTLCGGLHWGDGRLAAKPIIFGGIGYYFTNGLSLKIEYSPVIVEAKNNNYPKFRYEGEELNEGDEVIISEFFLMADFKIFECIWFDIGFAPEKLFSIKTSLKYLWLVNDNVVILAEYGLLIMGRPIGNSKPYTFVNSILTIGIQYSIWAI